MLSNYPTCSCRSHTTTPSAECRTCWKSCSGGELIDLSRLSAETREKLLGQLEDQARKAGGNAVLGLSFGTNSIYEGTVDMVAYGTARLDAEVIEAIKYLCNSETKLSRLSNILALAGCIDFFCRRVKRATQRNGHLLRRRADGPNAPLSQNSCSDKSRSMQERRAAARSSGSRLARTASTRELWTWSLTARQSWMRK